VKYIVQTKQSPISPHFDPRIYLQIETYLSG